VGAAQALKTKRPAMAVAVAVRVAAQVVAWGRLEQAVVLLAALLVQRVLMLRILYPMMTEP